MDEENVSNGVEGVDVGLISRGGGLIDDRVSPYLPPLEININEGLRRAQQDITDQVFAEPIRIPADSVRVITNGSNIVPTAWNVPLTQAEINMLRQQGNRVHTRLNPNDNRTWICDINTEGAVPPTVTLSSTELEEMVLESEINFDALMGRIPQRVMRLSTSAIEILLRHNHTVLIEPDGYYIDRPTAFLPPDNTVSIESTVGRSAIDALHDRLNEIRRDRPREIGRTLHIKDFTENLEGVILSNLMQICEFAHPNSTNTQAAKALAPLKERVATFAHILVTELTEMEIKIDGRKRKIILSDNELDRKLRERERIEREHPDPDSTIELDVREQSLADRREIGI